LPDKVLATDQHKVVRIKGSNIIMNNLHLDLSHKDDVIKAYFIAMYSEIAVVRYLPSLLILWPER
jgi:hypothetical protein